MRKILLYCFLVLILLFPISVSAGGGHNKGGGAEAEAEAEAIAKSDAEANAGAKASGNALIQNFGGKTSRGFAIPVQPPGVGLIPNFGPFIDVESASNIMPIGVAKDEFCREQAVKMLANKKRHLISESVTVADLDPTDDVKITDKKPEKGEVVGWVIIRSKNNKPTSINAEGLALLDAMDMGAETLWIIRNSADIKNQADGWYIGIGHVQAFIDKTGRNSGASVGGLGYGRAGVEEHFKPSIRGIAFVANSELPSGEGIQPEVKYVPETTIEIERKEEHFVTK